MDNQQLKYVIEAALLAAGKPMNVAQLQALFDGDEPPTKQAIRAAISELQADDNERGIEIIEVGNGFRTQVRASMAHQIGAT